MGLFETWTKTQNSWFEPSFSLLTCIKHGYFTVLYLCWHTVPAPAHQVEQKAKNFSGLRLISALIIEVDTCFFFTEVRWTRHFGLAFIELFFTSWGNISWMIRFFHTTSKRYWNNPETLQDSWHFLQCQVTQKLKGMQNSISKFNATLLNSSTGRCIETILVFVFGELMIDSQRAKQEAQALQKKNRRSKNMRWLQLLGTGNAFSVILLGRLRRSKKHWATWRIRHKEQSLTDGVTNGVYRSALHVFPWQKWKESSEKTWSFRIVSVRFSAERKNWLGRIYTKTLNTVDLFRWKDTLRLAHFCLGWGRAEWEELFRCSAELEVWPWRSFEMEAVVFEHVPKVRWTRHFCLALIAKAFLHMLKPQFIEFPTQFSSSLDYFKVWGSTEAEGNAKIHQQVQCDSSQLLNRPLYRNDFSVCFWWTDDRFAACQARGASAAEKEQKKQEHEVATTAWNWECFFRHFVGKVAEIQETLGNLKNKAQGAVPHGWSDKRSVSEGFACVSMAKMEGEQRKDMKFSDRISQVQCWAKELAGSNLYKDVEHSWFVQMKRHTQTRTLLLGLR